MSEEIEEKRPIIKKVSISKQEVAELPAESFVDKITIVDTPEAAEEAAKVLAAEEIIGFDTETRPSFKRGERHSVALLQLSTHKECFLIRLNKIGMPQCILDIMESEHPKKIGLSIHDDFLTLRKKFKLEPAGFIDLQAYVKDYEIIDNSLTRIYGILFGKRISKGQRLSNWEAPTLSEHQQEYAALDALACVHIYDYLREGKFDFNKSQYYREYIDPATLQQQQNEKNS